MSSSNSLRYYDENAVRYAQATASLDMSALYQPFLDLLPAGGKILDLGCGPGRDLQAFIARGYEVVGVDGSTAMVAAAKRVANCPVHHMTFDSIPWTREFDGIWACASLLHVPKSDLPAILARAQRALKPGGAFYVSFKHGEGERDSQGRRFTNLTESTLEEAIAGLPALAIRTVWLTEDVRPDRQDDQWLNALLVNGGGG